MNLFTGKVEIVKLLLNNGADRNLLNKKGETVLMVAEKNNIPNADEGYKQIIDLLMTN